MKKQYQRIYALLKNSGHTPVKSAEIILDATRHDKFALRWIWVLFRRGRAYVKTPTSAGAPHV